MFSCEFSDFSKNAFFHVTRLVAASEHVELESKTSELMLHIGRIECVKNSIITQLLDQYCY